MIDFQLFMIVFTKAKHDTKRHRLQNIIEVEISFVQILLGADF
jgi:F0F1-type ATP synthase membrane subunit a